MKKVNGKEDKCPKCSANWDAGDIFETLIAQDWWKTAKKNDTNELKFPTEESFREYIKKSYSSPYRFNRIIGVEDRSIYDGVSWWVCPDCRTYFDRWTGEESSGPIAKNK